MNIKMARLLLLLSFTLFSARPAAGAIPAPAPAPTQAASEKEEPDADILPTIDELGSLWLDPAQLAHMPSLHNFHDMAVCTPDMLGVNYFPGGTLGGGGGPRWMKYVTLPAAQLLLDGKPLRATQCRWTPFEAARHVKVEELSILTTVNLIPEGRGLMYKIEARNTGEKDQSANLTVTFPFDWTTTTLQLEPIIGYYDAISNLTMAYAFVEPPDSMEQVENSIELKWHLSVPPAGVARIQMVMAPEPDSARAIAEAIRLKRAFVEMWDMARRRWAERWRQAFTPGNPHFSGNLPLLKTTNSRLSEIYYRSILTLLVLERTDLALSDRVFVTSGERSRGTVYFWDTGLWPTVFALLEPRAMHDQLGLLLQCDPHAGGTFNFQTGIQGAGWHAGNAWSLFKLAWARLAVDGRLSEFNRTLAGRSMLDRLTALALDWRTLPRAPGGLLTDFGVPHFLLDCVPTYAHAVPSLNAANAWMMRRMAGVRERRGETQQAAELRAEADRIARAVLGLYVPGQGTWSCLQPDGQPVEVRHCIDFALVGSLMREDLPASVTKEMLTFVGRELLLNNWMRAMSLEDCAAELSDRPDHGPVGAYDAWPALTVGTMCELGDAKRAVMFLNQTQGVLAEGIYGQSHELHGPKRFEASAAVRIAQRGGSMRECTAGAAFAEMIITTLFGYRPEPGEAEITLFDPQAPRTFEGELRHVRRGADYYTITAGPQGVSLKKEPKP